jgi:hypothetical protein
MIMQRLKNNDPVKRAPPQNAIVHCEKLSDHLRRDKSIIGGRQASGGAGSIADFRG